MWGLLGTFQYISSQSATPPGFALPRNIPICVLGLIFLPHTPRLPSFTILPFGGPRTLIFVVLHCQDVCEYHSYQSQESRTNFLTPMLSTLPICLHSCPNCDPGLNFRLPWTINISFSSIPAIICFRTQIQVAFDYHNYLSQHSCHYLFQDPISYCPELLGYSILSTGMLFGYWM